MDIFTASNGMTFTPDGRAVEFRCTGMGRDHHLTAKESDGLREFFRAEEDERLGRWRWPDNPNYLVYPGNAPHRVRVVSEADGQVLTYERDEYPDHVTGFSGAGNAYFVAYPDTKSWHLAKPGEVWLVTVDGGHERPHYVEANRSDTIGGVAFVAIDPKWSQPGHVGIAAPAISGARRIWPEGGDE
jgi:hypothetical protein